MSPNLQKFIGLIILFLAVVLFSVYLGVWLATNKGSLPNPSGSGQAVNGLKLEPDSIIKSQQAIAAGKVVKVDNNNISLIGADGKVGTFRFAQNVSINSATSPSSSSSSGQIKSSQNPSSIKTGTNVMLFMTLQNQVYVVTSVTRLPDNQKL